jgi:hypothetical protein
MVVAVHGAVHGRKLVFLGGGDGVCYAFEGDGKIYLATEKHLHILAAGTELKLLNQIPLGSRAWDTPVAANGTLFVPSRNYLWAVQEQGAGK